MSSQTTATSPRRIAPRAGALRVVVVHAPDPAGRGATVALGSRPVVVGREPGGAGSLRLDDSEVSRAHAEISAHGEEHSIQHRIRDLESRNGTYVDGERISEAPIGDGSVIRVGAHVLLVQFVTIEDAQRSARRSARSAALAGSSFVMARVHEAIADIAPLDLPVLVTGESGVGKELVARALHERSGRSGPFVAVNCAALPAELAESELFGHARGAFTGASQPSRGLFGAAEGGTIFLDEIGETSPAMQAKLLRVLADGEVRAVGEQRARAVDARVVAATNVDLERAVAEGRFRGDLFARLAGARVEVPPLRARRDDVLPLLERFLAARGAKLEPSADAAEALVLHDWPYNVRELELFARGLPERTLDEGSLDLPDLPATISRRLASRALPAPASDELLELSVRRTGTPSAEELSAALAHFQGNIARTAELFGRDRRQIYRWMERYGLSRDAGEPGAGDERDDAERPA